MNEAIVHVSALAGSPLRDHLGERVGQVRDVVVRLDHRDPRPPVIGLRARIAGRDVFIPAALIDGLERAGARTAAAASPILPGFERRPGELLLRSDLLDRSLIHRDTATLVTAREVELVKSGPMWRVAGIDPSLRARLWRLAPRRFRGHDTEHTQFVDWDHIEPFCGRMPRAWLALTLRRLARLHEPPVA